MPSSRLLNEQGPFVDEEKEVDSETSNGKKKNSRDKPTLPFHFRDEQTGVQRGEVSAIVIWPVCGGATSKHHCFLLVMCSTIEGWYPLDICPRGQTQCSSLK